MLRKSFSILMVAAGVACASAGAGTGSSHSSDVITAEQIATTHESNAYDAINQIKPLWLKSRGQTSVNTGSSPYASVFVDGQYFGDLASLRQIIAPQIKEVRYLNGPNAVTRYGMQYGSGVIEVSTR
ncbi:MAG TPA: hypothetical protein VJ825_06175 [Gemmatimonadaceae bacterium]|nr:hypothetical protein [Gemmatimonadaceae bacterium]